MLILLALIGALTDPQQKLDAPISERSDERPLLAGLEGQWDCSGAFANGKSLHSRLEFVRTLEGNGLHLHQADLAPGSYVSDAVWSADKDSRQLLSLSWTGKQRSAGRSAAFYIGDNLTDTSVTMVQADLLKAPWMPNRFRYTLARGELQIVWEMEHGGAMGHGRSAPLQERQAGAPR